MMTGAYKRRLPRALLVLGGAGALLFFGLRGLPGKTRLAGDSDDPAARLKKGAPSRGPAESTRALAGSATREPKTAHSPPTVEEHDANPLLVAAGGDSRPAAPAGPKAPPDFDSIGSSLRSAVDPGERASLLETAFGAVDWRDPEQAASMTAILRQLMSGDASSRDEVAALLEHENSRQSLPSTGDPGAERQVAEAYLSLIDDPALQRRFILRARQRPWSGGSTELYDSLFTKVTGRAPRQDELDDEAPSVPPPSAEAPLD